MKYEHELATQLFARRIALDLTVPPPAAILATTHARFSPSQTEEIARLEALVLVQATELRRLAEVAEDATELLALHEWKDELEGRIDLRRIDLRRIEDYFYETKNSERLAQTAKRN